MRHGFADAAPYEPVFDYGYDAVMRSWEQSRRRLRRNRIDILLAHDLGRLTHGDAHPALFRDFLNHDLPGGRHVTRYDVRTILDYFAEYD